MKSKRYKTNKMENKDYFKYWGKASKEDGSCHLLPYHCLDVAAVDMLQSVIRQHVEQGGIVILTTHQEVELTSGKVKKLRLGWKRDGDV